MDSFRQVWPNHPTVHFNKSLQHYSHFNSLLVSVLICKFIGFISWTSNEITKRLTVSGWEMVVFIARSCAILGAIALIIYNFGRQRLLYCVLTDFSILEFLHAVVGASQRLSSASNMVWQASKTFTAMSIGFSTRAKVMMLLDWYSRSMNALILPTSSLRHVDRINMSHILFGFQAAWTPARYRWQLALSSRELMPAF